MTSHNRVWGRTSLRHTDGQARPRWFRTPLGKAQHMFHNVFKRTRGANRAVPASTRDAAPQERTDQYHDNIMTVKDVEVSDKCSSKHFASCFVNYHECFGSHINARLRLPCIVLGHLTARHGPMDFLNSPPRFHHEQRTLAEICSRTRINKTFS